ncbi:MAG: hypothetical protein IJ903_06440 [Ruminococcus sp.]|nr:hypothetical protein [Ruminococcus sp.]
MNNNYNIEIEAENDRLKEAVKEISYHMDEIQKILDGLDDILIEEDGKHVTEEDVINLLKKYSSL